MNKVKIILLLLLVPSCIGVKENSESINRMHYYKDDRTNLCFMGRSIGWEVGLLTNVPCTPEVLNLVVTE